MWSDHNEIERLIQRLYERCRDEDNRTCGERGEALLCDDCETACYLRILQDEGRTRNAEATPSESASSVGPEKIRVFVSDRKHPHYGESGEMTGKIISLFGKPMAEVRLFDCKHGTDGCFVSKGQVTAEKRKMR